MKRLIPLLTLLLLPLALCAQVEVEEHITIVDDEECGCELVFIDSIQTTKREGLFGFKLADGRELVEPKYKFVDQWHGDYCIVYRDYGQCGLINRRGQEVVPPVYDEVAYPNDGMIRVLQGNLYGYLTEQGAEAIAPQYGSASSFSEGYAVVGVVVDSHFFEFLYIDHRGQVALRNAWQYAYPFFNGYAVVKKYDKFGLIDAQGREVVSIKHDLLTAVDSNGIFIANQPNEDLLALFSVRGLRQLTPYRYDDFPGYGDGLFTFRRDGKVGYIDTEGRERFGLYDEAGTFHKGYAMVSRGGRCGIIDTEGNTVLPMEYEQNEYCNGCYRFQEGRAAVCKDGKFGFVDESGELVIPLIYDRCFGFAYGLAPVMTGNKWGYINTDGQMTIPFLFDAASPFKYGRAEVYYNGHTSKINTQGKCVKACQGFPVWRIVPIEGMTTE